MTEPPKETEQLNLFPKSVREADGSQGELSQAESNRFPASIDMESSSVAEASKALSGIFGYASGFRDRTLKSASAIAEGLRESSSWLVPSAFRNSQSYTIFIRQMLDYAHSDIDVRKMFAGVKAAVPEHLSVAQKSVDSLFDMTALAAFHVSPLTVLAIYGYLAFDDRTFIAKLAHQLKTDGMLTTCGAIGNVSTLLAAIDAASHAAELSFHQPPISAKLLRESISSIEQTLANDRSIRAVIPAYEIAQLWRQMEATAVENNAALWDIAAVIAVFALAREQPTDLPEPRQLSLPQRFFSRSLVDNYWNGIREIERSGLLPTLSEASEPYLDAIWRNFAIDRSSWTQQLLDGELLKWGWSKLGWTGNQTHKVSD